MTVNPNVAGGPDPSAGQYGFVDPNVSASVTIQKDKVGMTIDSLQTMFTQAQTQQGQSGIVNSNPGRPVLDMTVAQAISVIQSQEGAGDQVSTFLSLIDELPTDQKTALLTALSTGNMQDPSLQALYTALQTGTGIISAVQGFNSMEPTSATQSTNVTAGQNLVDGADVMINQGQAMVGSLEDEVNSLTPAQMAADGITESDKTDMMDFLKSIGTALSAAREMLGQLEAQDQKNAKLLTQVMQEGNDKKMTDAVNSWHQVEAERAAAAKMHGIMSILGPIIAAVGAIVCVLSILDAGATAGLGVMLLMIGITAATVAMSIPQCPLAGIVSGGIAKMMAAMKSVMPSWAADVIVAAVVVAMVVALRGGGGDAIGADLGENAAEDSGSAMVDASADGAEDAAAPGAEGAAEPGAASGGEAVQGNAIQAEVEMGAVDVGVNAGEGAANASADASQQAMNEDLAEIAEQPGAAGAAGQPGAAVQEEGAGEVANLGDEGAEGVPDGVGEGAPNQVEGEPADGAASSTARSTAQKTAIRNMARMVVVTMGSQVIMASGAVSDVTLALIKAIKGSTDADDEMIAQIVQAIVILVAAMAAISSGGGGTASLKSLQTAAKAFGGVETAMNTATGIYKGVVQIQQGQMEEALASLTADLTKLATGNTITKQQIQSIIDTDTGAGQTLSALGPFFANIVKDMSQSMTQIAQSVS